MAHWYNTIIMLRSIYWGLGLSVIILTGFILGGCHFQQPAPEAVVVKFTEAMANLTSFHYDVDLKLNGRLPIAVVQDISSLNLKFSGDADNQNPNQPQFTLLANVFGTAPQGSLALAGDLVNLADYTYFRLTNLALPTLLPISIGADSRWYKVRHASSINPDEHKLGVSNGPQFTSDQIQTIQNLISQTPIAEVLEVLPDATVNGQRSYHYRTQLKSEVLVGLLKQLNQSLNLTLALPASDQLAKYQPEVWVNKRTFQLSQLKLADLYLLNGVPVAFDLTLSLSRQNEQLKIVIPKNTEELDAERLIRERLPF